MSRTLTALFDTRADAEAGKARLVAANIDASHINIHDQGSMDSEAGYSTHQDRGVWNNTRNAFLPDEDRHVYEEGIRRGGVLLTADIDGDDAGRAVAALEAAESVDIDERAAQWRKEGWNYGADSASTGASMATGTSTANTGTLNTGTLNTGDTDRVQLAEEQLIVGKREVQGGGVRVRTYVTERPVHEQITLREEHVNIERRPVTGQATTGDANALFQERSIEVNATAEEAAVGKTSRVTEELVVSKTAGQRTETVSDTVRKTEVEIDETGTSNAGMRSGTTASTTGTAAGVAGGVASTAAGLGQEALGNIKQGIGSLTGNESLKQSGQAQERAGEAKQGKRD